MAVTDLTADMLTMIRNASKARKESVDIKCSKLLESMCGILKENGFINNFKKMEDNKQGQIKVYLKYTSGKPAITGIRKITRPGLRYYQGHKDIRLVYGGIGISILTTSEGLMTGKDARAKKIGGELLCYVW